MKSVVAIPESYLNTSFIGYPTFSEVKNWLQKEYLADDYRDTLEIVEIMDSLLRENSS
jgi:hypothetical protein